MTWPKIRLGELAFFQRGFDITKQEQEDGPYPVVSSSGIQSYHSQAKVAGPGVVIGRKGTLGSVHYLEDDFWPHDTTLWVKNFYDNNPRYVYYFLHTLSLERFDAGGANPTLNRNHIHDIKIQRPPRPVQNRIADILSAYDDLTANNNRRMALLEESIRWLYQEWFVRLRFPGHERVKVVNGVPEGWEKKPLEEVGFLNYGKSLTADLRIPGDIPVYGSSGIVGSHNEALVQGPTIIVGRKGNMGSVFWSYKACYPIDTVFYINSEQSNLYLYYNLASQNFISSDAAVPGLNRNYAHSLPVLIPSHSILTQFESIAQPIHRQIATLQQYNEQLATVRDLLLPRLMSGEIAA